MSTITNQNFNVSFHYPVVFERSVFKLGSTVLRDLLNPEPGEGPKRVAVFIDGGLAKAQPELAGRVAAYAEAHSDAFELAKTPDIVPGGEQIKNDYRLIMSVVDTLLEHRLCRQSYVLAIGGGAMLDAIGFATAIVHRGLRMLRMPSTVLAQNDAGIGVKNGMNLHGGKNTIGTFAPPFAVLNDFALLDSLDTAGWTDGISEAFKVAIIKDAAFFDRLCDLAPQLAARDTEAMEEMIIRCADLHLEHIGTSGDAFELGTARPLDFGHWAAHKLESLSNYRISHGHAVAIGIAIDAGYARGKGRISDADHKRIIDGLETSGFSLQVPELDLRLGDGSRAVLQGLADFQEHLGGELTITLPEGIGQKVEVNEMDHALLNQEIDALQERGTPRGARP